MGLGGWYVAKDAGSQQAGPLTDDAFRNALLSGQIAAADQIWREGMDGWESAAQFLWFAQRGAELRPPEAAPEPAAAKPRPAPHPPGGGGGGIGQLERPDKAAYAKIFGREIAIIEPDLADFAGPGAEPYLAFRKKMATKGQLGRLSWSWSAFFVPLAWFGYRRLQGAAFTVLAFGACALVIGRVLPSAHLALGVIGSVAAVVFAMLAKPLYLRRADGAAKLADELDLQPVKRAVLMASQGGVSKLGAWLGAFAHLAIYAFIVMRLLGGYVAGFASGWSS